MERISRGSLPRAPKDVGESGATCLDDCDGDSALTFWDAFLVSRVLLLMVLGDADILNVALRVWNSWDEVCSIKLVFRKRSLESQLTSKGT